MKRIVDKAYLTYSAENADLSGGIYVKCPKCQSLGIITTDSDKERAHFKCTNCGLIQEKILQIYRFNVQNKCRSCGRYYRIEIIKETDQHFPILHVACPYCGERMTGSVQKIATGQRTIAEITNGREPYFGHELWFLAYYDSKPIWALNRAHLHYLIEYLSADLREKPPGGYMKTQADLLPTFMKTAKNRKPIIKLFKLMQQKS